MALDVREISLLADYFVICSGNSERQINAIIDEVIDKEEENQVSVRRVEGKDGGKWVFSASERAFYNLEKLWSDAPLVDLNEWVVA